MKIVTNSKLIKRNAKIAKYATLAGFLLVGGAVVFSWVIWKDQITVGQMTFLMVVAIVGFIATQIGMFYTNRWGRSPRPDEVITKNLKGLGREYTIYHYVTPASHLLVSPAGLWIILPYYMAGTITYEKKRWRVKGGGFAQSYLRAFGQESIGRPDLDTTNEIQSVTRHLTRLLPEGTQLPEVRAALLFINPKAELKIDEAPLPAMTPKDLKEFLKARAKEVPVSESTLEMIRKALPQPEKEE